MTDDEAREHLRKAILLLDCAVPHFERAVRAEERRNAEGGILKEVTNRDRLKSVRKMIDETGPLVGFHPYP